MTTSLDNEDIRTSDFLLNLNQAEVGIRKKVIENQNKERPNSNPLIVLLLGDLFHLVEELADSKLKLRKLLLLSDVSVIDGVFANLDVEMNSLQRNIRDSFYFASNNTIIYIFSHHRWCC